VFRAEGDALPTLGARIEVGSIVHADEARHWDALHTRYLTKRINHQDAYSDGEACTNDAESFFSRLRRAEIGIHHHISGKYLAGYAHEMAWREDHRRVSNGEQYLILVNSALAHSVSRQWKATGNADENAMSIKTEIRFRGREYSIRHLAPSQFACPCPELRRDLTVEALFANHCYTRTFDNAMHTRAEILLYESDDRPRVFCPGRHELSHRLPQIVSSLPGHKVRQTFEGRNYVFSTAIEVGGSTYDVFFMLQRQRKGTADLRLTVESAYIPDMRRPTAGTVRFTVLAHHTYVGKSVRFGER